MDSRKLPEKYENPIDNILINIAEKLNPIFYKLGFNPNGITTLSLITGLLFNYYYYIGNYKVSALMMSLSYFFDCMDGNFARTYNMQTKFGDYYDHIKDIIVMLIFSSILLFYKDIPINYKFFYIVMVVILTFGMIIHVNCTEKYVKDKKKNIQESGFLSNFKGIVYDRIDRIRYLGCGTFNAFIITFVLVHKFF